MRWRIISSICVSALLLCGCGTFTQTSSGKDWLGAYPSAQAGRTDDIDARVRQAGAVEPTLRFPARIGIARLGFSRMQASLVAVPQEEAAAWMAAKGRLGDSFGEFVPVSPMIAAMVEPEMDGGPRGHVTTARHLVDTVRLAAARQHLDAVLIYEVDATADQKSNPLSLANWTIIGAFVLPSQDVKAAGVGQAMLIDVRNGYPYGQVTSSVSDKTMSAAFYSGEARTTLAHKVEAEAAVKLVDESEGMIRKLRDELAGRK